MKNQISFLEIAIKEKYRFPLKGENLSLEQLYDLSFKELIEVLVNLRAMVRSVTHEKCFENRNKVLEVLDIQTCILKHLIAEKLSVCEDCINIIIKC